VAFDISNLTRISAGPQQVWVYTTTDTYTGTVDQANYFLDPTLKSSDSGPHIQPNDFILCACATGGTDTFNVVGVLTSTVTGITTQAIV
jgi:hypothetical protein